MHWNDSFNRLDLNNHYTLNNQIHTIATVKPYIFVYNGQEIVVRIAP